MYARLLVRTVTIGVPHQDILGTRWRTTVGNRMYCESISLPVKLVNPSPARHPHFMLGGDDQKWPLVSVIGCRMLMVNQGPAA